MHATSCQIRFIEDNPAKRNRTDLEQMMVTVIGHLGDQIRDVRVLIRDVNGPKHGVDLKGRCLVKLRGRGQMVFDDRDESVRSLVRRIAHRVADTLTRQNERVRRVRRRRAAQRLDHAAVVVE